ncbi:hypothetical protein [Gottfriedia solisilvae]|uniref:Transposase n=1 Tax=Gottfriedia solisilvae TaxID=1516104 RepID=A0A8J3AT71_9BACI|nr:hypothetical protein [Gottfriedia solisilvae]GGI18474.1 hypothetical protein GCM10007380_43090 [Gottfriedia solisilvae]
MKFFWTKEALINYIKYEIDVKDYNEEENCDCPICNSIRFKMVNKTNKKLNKLMKHAK